MKVTGYKLREALHRWQLRRDTASGQFEASLLAFPGEVKPSPQSIVEAVLSAESAIAKLQTAQTKYNVRVSTDVAGVGKVSLLYCVKAIGGNARIEKLWRGAAGAEKKARKSYLYDATTRDKDTLQAVRVVSYDEAAKLAEHFGRRLAALREAVATGNGTELEIEDLDAALFE